MGDTSNNGQTTAPVGDANNSNVGGSRNYKAPPPFYDGMNYEDWKMDIELWKGFTTLAEEKQGAALLLELKEGKVKSSVRSLDRDVITARDGLTKIIEHLDNIYQEDSTHMTYRLLQI